ncbi:hypothetical protein SAMN06295937_100763 [Sphingopyxis flava]|uniref:Uncharacterized protein n=1 Tax=Sphingopyxis flava TaxID=1507287 RepID=A0A1T5BQT1_9SPHN|nr:hypothetical protein SAMN06295937_100763 [Sphingopyxis flava]
MSRASYIYLLGPDGYGDHYGFTVKHEAQAFARRAMLDGYNLPDVVSRIPDGGSRTGRAPKTMTLEEFINS